MDNKPLSNTERQRKFRVNHPNYYKDAYKASKERRLYHKNYQKQYNEEHQEAICKYRQGYINEKRKNNIKFRMDGNMSSCIRKELKGSKQGRRWSECVGYNIEELITHLENLFNEDMNWDNYGTYWVIDHIIPRSWFGYKDHKDQEFKECWALKNLQPLEQEKNAIKSDRGTIDSLIDYCLILFKLNKREGSITA